MKNSINLVAAILFLVVLGCSCPRLGKKAEPAPDSPVPSSNSTPSASRTPASGKVSSLTLEKFNRLKVNMPKSEVDRILGDTGTEVSSSKGGGVTFSVYKWSGENYTSIILSFKNDKIMTKSQVGLK